MKIFITSNLEKGNSLGQWASENDHLLLSQSLLRFEMIEWSTLPKSDWIFFYSRRGVKFFFRRWFELQSNNFFDFKRKIASMGKGTNEELIRMGLKSDFVGSGNPVEVSKQFLKFAQGDTVLFARASNSRRSVQRELDGKIVVNEILTYHNEIISDLTIPYYDVIIFTSPMNVDAFLLNHNIRPKQVIISNGKHTSDHLQNKGVQHVQTAKGYGVDEILDELKRCL